MFSSIIEFIQKLQEMKLRKQKQKVKGETKKEEKKLEKETNSVVEVKDKAKKSENVVKEKEKINKLKLKVLLLRLLKWTVQIVESFVAFMLGVFGTLGFFIILAVIVIMIAIYGLLHIDFDLPSGDFFSGKDNCIQGNEVFTSEGFDMSQIGSLMGTFTKPKRQAAEVLSMYSEIINRDLSKVVIDDKYITEIKNKMGVTNLIYYLYGFGAIENTGGLQDIPTNGDSLFKYPSLQDSSGYVFLGLHRGNSFNGYYSYNGSNSGTQVLQDSFVSEIKTKYTPSESPKYENNFMPYGVSTQIGIVSCNYLTNKYNNVTTELDSIMDEYGIKANREILKGFIQLFAASASYHSGGNSSMGDETDREGLFSLWCALWSTTSENDSARNFNNIKIVNSSYNYTEPQMRPYIFGSNNFNMTWGETKSGYFEINGKSVDTVLWDWVSKNCSNPEYFNQTGKIWLDGHQGGTADTVLTDSSYGLAAYLIGKDLTTSIGATAPIASGGSSEDCDCYEGSGSNGNLGDIDISNITVGEAQGPWNNDLMSKINNRVSTSGKGPFKAHFGKTLIPNSAFTKAEAWRQSSKWKVPYYHQSNILDFASNNLTYHGKSLNACGTYMLAYLMSASTGKMINPIEAFAVGLELGIFQSDGLMSYSQSNFNKLNEYGINITTVAGGGLANKQKIDACLDNGGLVGIRSTDPNNIFVATEHFFVITEKVGDKYNVYSAAGFDRDANEGPFTFTEVTLGATRFFLVDNINRESVNSMTLTGTVHEVPSNVVQSGLVKDYTNYSYFYPRWNEGTAAREIANLWGTTGKKSNKGIATINDYFLVAVRPRFGNTGDAISIFLEDGTNINCIVADVKGADAKEWGHLYGNAYSLVEWEVIGSETVNANGEGVNIELGDWNNKKVTKIVNGGKYSENFNFKTNSNKNNPNCISNGIVGAFKETPGKFQGPWGDLTESVEQITNANIKNVSKNLIQYVGLKPKNEGQPNYSYNVDKWKSYNGSGFVRYSQTGTRNLGEDWGTVSFGDSTFYNAACGAYSASGVVSTLLGKYITPAELIIAMNTYSVRHPGKTVTLSHINGDSNGAITYTALAAVLEECGLNVTTSGTFNSDSVDNCLNNNGMVIYVVGDGYNNRYTAGGHYIVIREKTSTGYLVYSSTNWSNTSVDAYCNTENTMVELQKLSSSNSQMILVTP